MTKINNLPRSLYIHVPFCRSICYYCDFCHVIYNKDLVSKWLNALRKEIDSKNLNKNLHTIYIGGGTPTSLDVAELDQLLSFIDPYSKKVKEYTIEVNPETLTKDKVEILVKHGVNRISMGVQTENDTLLKQMNRHHTFCDVKESYAMLLEHGITNISLDLMYSLPNQSLEDFSNSIDTVLTLDPNHLSLYSLQIEENTVFGKKGVTPLDEDTEADMYELACSKLKEAGYIHYEISNFAKKGYESKHNLCYWKYNDFYGLSCGASGKEGNIRYDKSTSIKEYIRDPYGKEEIILSKEDEMFEQIMMSLRLKKGLDVKDFQKKYNEDVYDVYGDVIEKNIRYGYLDFSKTHLFCTDTGFELLNTVLEDFLFD